MEPAMKRFEKKFRAAADAISRLDVAQEDRERVAAALAEAFTGQPDFKAQLFAHLASDPVCACAGPGEGEPCPHGREIRVSMHLSTAPNGRSAAWRKRKPTVRCIECGTRYAREAPQRGGGGDGTDPGH